jgi:hypothetical protein
MVMSGSARARKRTGRWAPVVRVREREDKFQYTGASGMRVVSGSCRQVRLKSFYIREAAVRMDGMDR